jgi:hypothetical protein
MPIIAVSYPYAVYKPGQGLPDVPSTGVELTSEQIAAIQAIMDSDPRNKVRLVELVNGGWQPLPETPFEEALFAHINDATPHPAYDDIPSLVLLFENGLA